MDDHIRTSLHSIYNKSYKLSLQEKLSYAILDLPQNNKHSRFPFDLGAEFLFKEEKFDPSD